MADDESGYAIGLGCPGPRRRGRGAAGVLARNRSDRDTRPCGPRGIGRQWPGNRRRVLAPAARNREGGVDVCFRRPAAQRIEPPAGARGPGDRADRRRIRPGRDRAGRGRARPASRGGACGWPDEPAAGRAAGYRLLSGPDAAGEPVRRHQQRAGGRGHLLRREHLQRDPDRRGDHAAAAGAGAKPGSGAAAADDRPGRRAGPPAARRSRRCRRSRSGSPPTRWPRRPRPAPGPGRTWPAWA